MRVTERFHCYPRQRPLCRRLRIRPETADCLMAVAVVAASVIWLGRAHTELTANKEA